MPEESPNGRKLGNLKIFVKYIGKNIFTLGFHPYLNQDDHDYVVNIFGDVFS